MRKLTEFPAQILVDSHHINLPELENERMNKLSDGLISPRISNETTKERLHLFWYKTETLHAVPNKRFERPNIFFHWWAVSLGVKKRTPKESLVKIPRSVPKQILFFGHLPVQKSNFFLPRNESNFSKTFILFFWSWFVKLGILCFFLLDVVNIVTWIKVTLY